MGEAGLSASEVGKEIAEHRKHHGDHEASGHDRTIGIAEAILLAALARRRALRASAHRVTGCQ